MKCQVALPEKLIASLLFDPDRVTKRCPSCPRRTKLGTFFLAKPSGGLKKEANKGAARHSIVR
jgi:hypothetical protein